MRVVDFGGIWHLHQGVQTPYFTEAALPLLATFPRSFCFVSKIHIMIIKILIAIFYPLWLYNASIRHEIFYFISIIEWNMSNNYKVNFLVVTRPPSES